METEEEDVGAGVGDGGRIRPRGRPTVGEGFANGKFRGVSMERTDRGLTGMERDDVCGIGTRGMEGRRRQQWRLTGWLTVRGNDGSGRISGGRGECR